MGKTIKQSRWVYEYEEDPKYRRTYLNEQGESATADASAVRYVLGEIFADAPNGRVLICIGVNPSTAVPNVLDPTLRRVQSCARKEGYGAWYMLNLYPQRATDPNDMHPEADYALHGRNIDAIRNLLKKIPQADVWVAWGATIRKRPYLMDLLYGNRERGIEGILEQFAGDYRLVAYAATKDGHPAHPLMMKKDSPLLPLEHFPELKKR